MDNHKIITKSVIASLGLLLMVVAPNAVQADSELDKPQDVEEISEVTNINHSVPTISIAHIAEMSYKGLFRYAEHQTTITNPSSEDELIFDLTLQALEDDLHKWIFPEDSIEDLKEFEVLYRELVNNIEKSNYSNTSKERLANKTRDIHNNYRKQYIDELNMEVLSDYIKYLTETEHPTLDDEEMLEHSGRLLTTQLQEMDIGNKEAIALNNALEDTEYLMLSVSESVNNSDFSDRIKENVSTDIINEYTLLEGKVKSSNRAYRNLLIFGVLLFLVLLIRELFNFYITTFMLSLVGLVLLGSQLLKYF